MRNFTITGVWGRPIRINIPLVVFLPILVWLSGIVAAVGMFVSVPLHELGHSWVALRYGIKIEWITLWILGGLAALKSIPRRFQSWLPGSIKYRARFWPGRERGKRPARPSRSRWLRPTSTSTSTDEHGA